MANLQIKIDDSLRDDAQHVAGLLGLDVASAVRMFLVQMVKHNGLPFVPVADPFYSVANQRYLKRAIADIENGINVEQHDLIED
jgi:DNA-damage-inducible protein J